MNSGERRRTPIQVFDETGAVSDEERFDKQAFDESLYDSLIKEIEEIRRQQDAGEIETGDGEVTTFWDVHGVLSPLYVSRTKPRTWRDTVEVSTGDGHDEKRPLSPWLMRKLTGLAGRHVVISDTRKHGIDFLSSVSQRVRKKFAASQDMGKEVYDRSNGDVLFPKIRAVALEAQRRRCSIVMIDDFLGKPEAQKLAHLVFQHILGLDNRSVEVRLFAPSIFEGITHKDVGQLKTTLNELGATPCLGEDPATLDSLERN